MSTPHSYPTVGSLQWCDLNNNFLSSSLTLPHLVPTDLFFLLWPQVIGQHRFLLLAFRADGESSWWIEIREHIIFLMTAFLTPFIRHFNHVYNLPRYTVLPGHEHKACMSRSEPCPPMLNHSTQLFHMIICSVIHPTQILWHTRTNVSMAPSPPFTLTISRIHRMSIPASLHQRR